MKVVDGGPLPPELLEELKGPFAFTVRRRPQPDSPPPVAEAEAIKAQPNELTPGLREAATRLGLSLKEPTLLHLWMQLAGKTTKTPEEREFLKEVEFAMTPAQRNSLLW